MEQLIVVAVFFVLVLVTIGLGVRIVPQGSKHVVQACIGCFLGAS